MNTTPVDIDSLLNDGKRIFVRSNKKGIIALTLHGPNGRAQQIAIPNTRLPVCLSEMATPNALRESRSLRECIGIEALTLIDPGVAETELQVPGARAKLKAAHKRISRASTEVMQARKERGSKDFDEAKGNILGKNSVTSTIDQAMENINPHTEIEAAASEDTEYEAPEPGEMIVSGPEISDEPSTASRIEQICGLLAQKDEITPEEAEIELANMIEDISPEDLRYIISHVGGNAARVKTWAENHLAVLTGVDVPAEVKE